MTGTYRLTLPTLGISPSTRTGVSIPAGEFIEIIIAPAPENRTVDVMWAGKPMIMFVRDIQSRSVRIFPKAASA